MPPVRAAGWILPESTLTTMGKRLWKFAVLSAFLAAVTGRALTGYLISIPQIQQILVDMATSFAEGWGEGISVLEVSGIFLLVIAWFLTVGFQELYDSFVSRYLEYVHDISRSIEAAGPDQSKLSEELSRAVALVNSTSAFGKIRINQNVDSRHFAMKFRSPRLISVLFLILILLAA
jgi:hypothetical protein